MWWTGFRGSASGQRTFASGWRTSGFDTGRTRAMSAMTLLTFATGSGPGRSPLPRPPPRPGAALPLRRVRVLVVNAGSSTLKLRLLDDGDDLVASRTLAAPEGTIAADELSAPLQALDRPDAVGHRI